MSFNEILKIFEASDRSVADAEEALDISGCGSLLELYEAAADENIHLDGASPHPKRLEDD